MILKEIQTSVLTGKDVTPEQLGKLEEIISKYPYFQMPRALYLKAMKEKKVAYYLRVLPKASLCTIDREVLRDFLEGENSIEAHTKAPQEVAEADNAPNSTEQIKSFEDNTPKIVIESVVVNDSSEVQKGFEKIREELSLFPKTNLKRGRRLMRSKRDQLIEAFLRDQPKIIPDKTGGYTKENFAERNQEEKELVTETLAEVYTEQRKYDQAIEAYRILSLKNPQKSTFFAALIDEIEKLK